jgi:hypothetical protein
VYAGNGGRSRLGVRSTVRRRCGTGRASAYVRPSTCRRQDLRAEFAPRSRQRSFAFALVILLLFSFAFDPPTSRRADLGRLLWIVFAFAGTLVLNRSFARAGQRLPGRADRGSHSGSALFWQGASELLPGDGGRAGFVAGVRHFL